MIKSLYRVSAFLTMLLLGVASALAADRTHDTLILTSTNDPAGNQVVVFKLNSAGNALTLVNQLPTGGKGGAAGNAGSVQFTDPYGAVVNYGSNTVTRLVREGDSILVVGTMQLAPNCVQPVSVALQKSQAFVLGSNCAESHAWPSGTVDGSLVSLSDASGAQIVAGQTWAAVTLKSG